MMRDLMLAALGAIVGLFVSWLRIKFTMPGELQMIDMERRDSFGMPLFSWNKHDRKISWRVFYVVLSPISLGIVGAFFAVYMFGGTK